MINMNDLKRDKPILARLKHHIYNSVFKPAILNAIAYASPLAKEYFANESLEGRISLVRSKLKDIANTEKEKRTHEIFDNFAELVTVILARDDYYRRRFFWLINEIKDHVPLRSGEKDHLRKEGLIK